MKKSFGVYSIIWAICLAVFNLIVFITPNEICGMNKFGGAFWVGYIFITFTFCGQLACAFFALRAKNLTKTLYNIPLISISYTALVVMLIVGTLCMAIPSLPEWIGIILCALVLAINAIAIIKAVIAANVVSGIDEKVKNQNLFIKELTERAHNLMDFAKSNKLCAEAKKVYEAVRYSDPVSTPALFALDAQIEREFTAFSAAVRAEDYELAKETAHALVEIIDRRNQECKLLK